MKNANYFNTLILLPVYNSGKHLDKLLKQIIALSKDCNIFCVNDGSTDNSVEIINNNNVKYIDRKINRGKGYSLKEGFIYAKKNGYKYVLTIDSDLQHDPAMIPNFFITQKKENANLVIGFREFKQRAEDRGQRAVSREQRVEDRELKPETRNKKPINIMPFARVMSNNITSCIVSCISNKKIYDSQSGYRLYDLDYFMTNEIKTDLYQMETEILLNFIKKDAKISHVEIPVIYHDEESHISHCRDIKNFIKIIWDEI